MDLCNKVIDDVNMWQSNSGNAINNGCMIDTCNNVFDIDMVNLLCTKLF